MACQSFGNFLRLYALDPTGIFFGELNDEIIALFSGIKFQDDSSTFISALVVKKEYRRKGYAWQMWINL